MVAQGVELAADGRVAVEPRLREQPVEDDDRAVRQREPVGPAKARDRAADNERRHERHEEERLLPGGDDVERKVTDTRLPEEGHREVVDGEADEEDCEREAGEASGHVVATSVRPRFEIRTGTGKSARSSAGPRRWFSRAHDLPVRS